MTWALARVQQLLTSRSSSASVIQSLAARILVIAVNLLTGVTVARALAPTGRGEQAAIMLWPLLLAGLLTFGLPTALRYQARRRPDIASQLFSSACLLSFAQAAIAIVIGVLFIPHWLAKYPPGTIRFAQIAMIFAPNIFIGNAIQAFLESRGDFVRSNQIFALPPIATLLALLTLLACHALTPFSASIAYMLPSVFFNALMAYRLRTSFQLRLAGPF